MQPLYISALKGHERCVELLIQHCQAAGISWQSQRLYGHDGWCGGRAGWAGTAWRWRDVAWQGARRTNALPCMWH